MFRSEDGVHNRIFVVNSLRYDTRMKRVRCFCCSAVTPEIVNHPPFDGFWSESAWECVLACVCVTQTTICRLSVTLSVKRFKVLWRLFGKRPLTPDPLLSPFTSPETVLQPGVKRLVSETNMAVVCHLLSHVPASSSPWNFGSCRSAEVIVTPCNNLTPRSEVKARVFKGTVVCLVDSLLRSLSRRSWMLNVLYFSHTTIRNIPNDPS